MAADIDIAVAARLRRVAQRYTPARRTLVAVLSAAGRPLTAAELGAATEGVPQSTIYRNLALLEQAGAVRRVHGGDGFGRFELAEELTGDHHHHLVCIGCGAVEDFVPPRRVERVLDAAAGSARSASGFVAESHRLDLLGTCAACAR